MKSNEKTGQFKLPSDKKNSRESMRGINTKKR